LDPVIELRPSVNQIDDLMEQIQQTIEQGERTLVTTLTKRMAEELDAYLQENGIHSTYMHSDIDTLDRVHILDELRAGTFDVLIGVNLLREGLDLPEVSLVAILDADKEGFLRNARSLTQTAGRAARNVHGRVIFYADRVTESMQRTMDETARRRLKQMDYNREHHITPRPISKGRQSLLDNEELAATRSQFGQDAGTPVGAKKSGKSPGGKAAGQYKTGGSTYQAVADTASATVSDVEADYESIPKLQQAVAAAKELMLRAARDLDFIEAAHQRDYMLSLEERIKRLQDNRK
jgi:excinuclease ABC subunit B